MTAGRDGLPSISGVYLRPKSAPKTVDQHFDRVATSYQLNETMMKSRSRRALKNTVNGLLNLSRLGDSLKVFAVK